MKISKSIIENQKPYLYILCFSNARLIATNINFCMKLPLPYQEKIFLTAVVYLLFIYILLAIIAT